LQLSLHADYACRVLIFLASSGIEKASIQEIAEAYGISENHLVKVVHRLGKEGFLINVRGRGGGIALAKQPDQISIGDVVRKMEPNFYIVECFDSSKNTCCIAPVCGLKHVLAKAKEGFLSYLDAVTVADVSTNRQALKSLFNDALS
jgi:Rrf2 family nitric oxide-sensitive transcriptional repressor